MQTLEYIRMSNIYLIKKVRKICLGDKVDFKKHLTCFYIISRLYYLFVATCLTLLYYKCFAQLKNLKYFFPKSLKKQGHNKMYFKTKLNSWQLLFCLPQEKQKTF